MNGEKSSSHVLLPNSLVVSFYNTMMEKDNLEIDKSTPNLTVKIDNHRTGPIFKN